LAVSSLTITSGSTLVVCICENSPNRLSSVVYNDGTSNYALTLRVSYIADQNSDVYIYSIDNAEAAAGGGSITITNTQVWVTSMTVYEVTGANTAGAFVKSCAAGARDTARNSGNTATTSQNDEAVIGCIGVDGSFTVNSWDGTATENVQADGTGASYIKSATKIVTSTGTYNVAATLSAKNYWVAAVATFKMASTGGYSHKVMGVTPSKVDGVTPSKVVGI
jgi:hypothetical protein